MGKEKRFSAVISCKSTFTLLCYILRRKTTVLLTRGLTSDFDSVCALYARVTSAMHEKGIAQWNWGT